ncbi:hypothetical protein CSC80_09200 [Maribacter sp. 6B07]|uniref:hypothetical protein n=1 Tax=Maribacter sp. 6B07 TaxID=2045442 RepID=UPI000C069BEA|nr:hypothetical protein [Maribacter sp. 6B07]PHN95484.1 hypothetical protein CSC80_09200 [Maribacter sp. 6B07]
MTIRIAINKNQEYYKSMQEQIVLENQYDGKSLLNKEIDKLYKRNKYVKGQNHFEEIIVKCAVIIEKMKKQKRVWSNRELNNQLEGGIYYYLNGFDNTISEFYRKPPKIISPDGHIVRSNSELIIDLWLNYHSIKHDYEPLIYKNKKVVIISDFYLPEYDCYIEYWGLEGDSEYEKRKLEKIKTYEELKLRLISIYNQDLNNLDKLLAKIKNVP